ncbi:hypothetical protein EDB92DRAFT_94937 [Lactarius akahatsu]|uniref:Uncharacterized protein n=1 Tax=Lactarius akahatsu TaxID=416441 RepID=A0AAD4LVP4_9AGAM|nr:hypothetical protein EDB92DRAFT_94937 [Lactarius akahatsu]
MIPFRVAVFGFCLRHMCHCMNFLRGSTHGIPCGVSLGQRFETRTRVLHTGKWAKWDLMKGRGGGTGRALRCILTNLTSSAIHGYYAPPLVSPYPSTRKICKPHERKPETLPPWCVATHVQCSQREVSSNYWRTHNLAATFENTKTTPP